MMEVCETGNAFRFEGESGPAMPLASALGYSEKQSKALGASRNSVG
jgi:hypothetical protein